MIKLLLFPAAILICMMSSCSSPEPNKTMSAEEMKVRQVILNLFQAMYDGDSSAIRPLFDDSPLLYTIYQRNDSTFKVEGGLNQFLQSVGTPHQVKWIEKSWDYKISIDGGLAQVWCQYAFFAGERFSHCGVDAFQLVKSPQGWRIFTLADTRRKDGCLFPTGKFFEPE
ncbi:nuclear transport factor 2 family protein [Reichenbachiella agariperforans]|nr:nuclear transport factor 2 family protein [Reichenbachiella agariperforans]